MSPKMLFLINIILILGITFLPLTVSNPLEEGNAPSLSHFLTKMKDIRKELEDEIHKMHKEAAAKVEKIEKAALANIKEMNDKIKEEVKEGVGKVKGFKPPIIGGILNGCNEQIQHLNGLL
ncbi:hypothetical protein LSTR_LSTR010351 [Laodelphax striatellus]|uniref:Uncharacterized protein n=1 Tax=Laodelphax striatellus TaxID=195883 RepID=A0A482X099_LAOST|nr:hypothetical protein LSTR_LSTR010351 [Laodelphax striatellus]